MWIKKTLFFVTLTTFLILIRGSSRGQYTRRRNDEYRPYGSSIKNRCKFCDFHSIEESLVCGTNGKTYFSACFLRVTACMEGDVTLQLRHRGRCRSSYRWNYEDATEEDSSEFGRNNHESDSSQFGDESERRDEVEIPDDEIQSVFTTPPPFDKDMNDPGTICPQQCRMTDLAEVCGSDGLTYASACFLQLAACQPDGNTNLRMAYEGHCKKKVIPTSQSEGITNESGLGDAIVAELSDEDCCPLDLYDPVCARVDEQEITFRSKCAIECLYMRQSLNIEIIKQGNCDDRFALQGLQTFPLTCGNMIDYDVNDVTSYASYISQLMQMYDDYAPIRQRGLYKNCAEGTTPKKQYGRLCKFKQRQFGNWCSPENTFGYANGQPCIMLQLTKVSKWMPINYKKPPKKIARLHRQNYITVTCNEIIDSKRRINATKIFPKNGFGFQHFPYMETERWPYQRQYLSPAVLVRIIPRKLNVSFRIKCRAWAKNIEYKSGIYANMYQAEAIMSFNIKNDILQYKMSRL